MIATSIKAQVARGHGDTQPPKENRRQLGVYYTPPELSGIVSTWAVRKAGEKILEPSFGGCVFLRTIAESLKIKGARKITSHLFGCDVDALAFKHLKATFKDGFPKENFPKKSFLATRVGDFKNIKFDAVVGNPPYVSYQNMTSDQRLAVKSLDTTGFSLHSKASLWAYFVVHGISFLKSGGRMGWILPGSVSFTDYGRDLLEQLASHFVDVTAIKLQQRCFGHVGTDESTVILLCDKFRGKAHSAKAKTVHAIDLEECSRITSGMLSASVDKSPRSKRTSSPSLDDDVAKLIGDLQAIPGLRRLGEVADVKIGVVTGANRFFLLSQRRADELSVPREGRLGFFTRFYQAAGLYLQNADMEAAQTEGEDCLLLDTRRTMHSPAVIAYLNTFERKLRESNETFKKGAFWHQPQLGQISDGFLSYMHDAGPRLVLNQAGVYCTNSIHRVFFKPNVTEVQKLVACIAVASTVGQLVAEIEGRSYGSGVLKIEPSEARRIFVPSGGGVPLSEAKKVAVLVDKLFRENCPEEARKHADSFVFQLLPSIGRHVSQTHLRLLLTSLRVRRSPNLKLTSRKPDGAANGSS